VVGGGGLPMPVMFGVGIRPGIGSGPTPPFWFGSAGILTPLHIQQRFH
jgi:hypothetical protein